jgi:hypothetical protein
MSRRIISSCVLAGFVVTQWAAMPHAHASDVSHDHDQTPHVHVGHIHDHGHSHKHSHGHRHTHQQKAPKLAQTRELTGLGIDSCRSNHHDSSAIYLPVSSTTFSSDCSQVKSHSLASLLLLTVNYEPVGLVPGFDENARYFAYDTAASCPLYLALRTLRI